MGFGSPARNKQERSLDRANQIVATLERAEELLKEDGAGGSATATSIRNAIRDRTRIRDKRRAQLAQRREGER